MTPPPLLWSCLEPSAFPLDLQLEAALREANSSGVGRGPQVIVQLVYLRSYDRMGRANVECAGGGWA